MATLVEHGQEALDAHVEARLLFRLLDGHLRGGVTHVGPSAGHGPASVGLFAHEENLVTVVEDGSADVDFGGDVLLHGVVAGGDFLVREAADDGRDAVAEAEQLLTAVGLVITHGVRESGLRQSAHALCDGDECFGFFHRE